MPIRSSYELTRLFLALSDVCRLDILNLLCERTSVVDICRRFDLFVHEAVRHLRRLDDVGLVRQLPNGDYIISEYGKVVITYVEALSNVQDLLEYWECHSAAELPPHLNCLPADLSEFFIADGNLLVTVATDMVRQAKRCLWALNYIVDEKEVNASSVKVLWKHAATTKRSVVRQVSGVSTVLLLNEDRALISFPRTSNDASVTDTSCGFVVAASSTTYRQLVDLFDFFWESGLKAD